jgi:hypothetical protein
MSARGIGTRQVTPGQHHHRSAGSYLFLLLLTQKKKMQSAMHHACHHSRAWLLYMITSDLAARVFRSLLVDRSRMDGSNASL